MDLGFYFQINNGLYRISDEDFETNVKQRLPARTTNLVVMDSGNELELYQFAKENMTSGEDRDSDVVKVLTNSLFGIVGAFHNKQLKDNVCRLIGSNPHFKDHPEDLTASILVSAAMRTIFGKTTRDFQYEVDKVIEGQQPNWGKATKIGVQMRLENKKWLENARVSFSEIECFCKEVEKLIENSNISNPLVFITSDNEEATVKLHEMLSKRKIKSFFDNVHDEPAHIDRTKTRFDFEANQVENKELWMVHVRSFSDWVLLTKMDHLVISRSGFAESAHHFSLAPTRRLMHDPSRADRCWFVDYKISPSLRMEPNFYQTSSR